ncbi:MAG: 3,4-dihydroxy-2-butanone-4-phosphate synthase [Bacteroidota bacterium]
MFDTVEKALVDFAKGKPIIVVDDESRENEGDIIISASLATPDLVNFCVQEARGLLCIAIDDTIANRLDLRKVRSNHKDHFHTAFLDSVDAIATHGVSTGISASDRATTARLIANEKSTPADFSTPGHLFPLLAVSGGVLVRNGHTEASVDLCKLAGLPPAALICEILDKDGTMLRRAGLRNFADQHQLSIISIALLQRYRREREVICVSQSTASLPTKYGDFTIEVFRNRFTGIEHTLLSAKADLSKTPIVRLHSECLTGDVLGSARCDCGSQLKLALRAIQQHGHGYLIYVRGHEGRGIGLTAKIAAYALQEEGMNTYEANQALGYHSEQRDFSDAIEILKKLQLPTFTLLTNNPYKINLLREASFNFEVKSIQTTPTPQNRKYLSDKASIGAHSIFLHL